MPKNKNPPKVLETLRVDDHIICVESGNSTGATTKAYLAEAYQIRADRLIRGDSVKRLGDTDWFINDWTID